MIRLPEDGVESDDTSTNGSVERDDYDDDGEPWDAEGLYDEDSEEEDEDL